MLVILLDMEHDGASELHLGQKVKVPQYEENFALSFELCDHELLIGEKIILLVLVPSVHLLVHVTDDLVLSELAISEREYIVAALDHVQGEVQISELEIYVSNLALSLRLGGWS